MIARRAPLEHAERWRTASFDEQVAVALDVAQAMGPGFTARKKPLGFTHELWPDLGFVLVPGGTMEMGLTETDLGELSEHIDWTKDVRRTTDAMLALATPVHHVDVRPFIVAERLLRRTEIQRLSADVGDASPMVTRENAKRLTRHAGWRLPSEAELEWLARDGGRFSFICDGGRAWSARRQWPLAGSLGVLQLSVGEWAEDDWHDSYAGAPNTSAPWLDGSPCGVFRGELPVGPDQDPFELCYGLAAHRNRGALATDADDDHAFFGVRLARDVP